MKQFALSALIFLIPFAVFGDVRSCLKDAETNGNHTHAVAPDKECFELLKNLPARKEVSSFAGNIKVVGHQNMFYVTTEGSTVLMAGDQTRLEDIEFIVTDEQAKKIFVYQVHEESASIATYRSDFVGNVAPLSFYSSRELQGLSNVAFLAEKNELALIFKTQGKIVFMNALGDSRYKGEKFSPKFKRTLSGEGTGLKSPVAVAYAETKKELYVLDSERVLVFNEKLKLERILKAEGTLKATQMILDKNGTKLFLYHNSVMLRSLDL